MKIPISNGKHKNESAPNFLQIKIGNFTIDIPETIDPIKKYGFIEKKNDTYISGFTEIRKFGKFRYFIRSTTSKTYSICNQEDIDSFCKYYLKLS